MDNSQPSITNKWEQAYQNGTTGWDRGDISPNLLHWIEERQLQPCRILVPGCGNGYEALHLATEGFEVVAIDIAATAIANLNKALKINDLTAEAITADFFNWTPAKPFDAIYEQTSLCALPLDQWKNYEQCLYHWLTPNGKLLAQFMQTNEAGGPPYHCEISDMLTLFLASRWQWGNEYKTKITHSSGKHERVYLLEKN